MRIKPTKFFLLLAALLPALLISSCGNKCRNGCDGQTYTSANNSAAPGEIAVVPAEPSWLAPTKPATPEVPIKPVEIKTPVDAKVTEIKPTEPKLVEIKPEPRVEVKKVEPKVEPKAAPLERKITRIRAGSVAEWKDKNGNVWLPDSGFIDGAMVDRGKVSIENSEDDELYSTERCCMDKFSWPVANGKYAVKLHFAETFEDVKKAGDRLFSMDVMGEKVKDFDILKEAGGANKAVVKTFKVNVTNSKIEITFQKVDPKEPAINGIEILPE